MTEGAKCVFCGLTKKGLWRSDVAILVDGKPLGVLTVCPGCRKNHTLWEFYKALAARGLEEMKAQVEAHFSEGAINREARRHFGKGQKKGAS